MLWLTQCGEPGPLPGADGGACQPVGRPGRQGPSRAPLWLAFRRPAASTLSRLHVPRHLRAQAEGARRGTGFLPPTGPGLPQQEGPTHSPLSQPCPAGARVGGAVLGGGPGWGCWGPAGVGRTGLSGRDEVPGAAVLAPRGQGSRARGARSHRSWVQHLSTWRSTGNHRASEQMCALGQAPPTPPVFSRFPCPHGGGCLSCPWAPERT